MAQRIALVPTLTTCVAAVVAATVSGCTSLVPAQTARDAPTQFRIDIAPFAVWTDFLLAEHDPIVDGLRSLPGDLELALQLPPIQLAAPIEIFIFDNRATFDGYMRAHYPSLPRRRAFFVAHGQRRIVYAYRDQQLEEDLRHEACHALLHATIGPIPLWLDEGLAEYFETPAANQGLHARHLTDLQSAIPSGWRPGLTRLEGLAHVGQMTARDYREAWAWVYFLLHHSPEHRDVLLGYLRDRRDRSVHEPLSARLFQSTPRPDVALVAFLADRDPTSQSSEQSVSDPK